MRRELEARVVSTIRLSLIHKINFSILNETFHFKLWEKLEKKVIYIYIKKQLFELKMNEK